MADFIITISESLRVFGPAPTNKWAEYNWNAFKWGEGTNPVALGISVGISETETLTDSFGVNTSVSLSETVTASDDLDALQLRDTQGYDYVFVSSTINAADRSTTTYTRQSTSTPTWTSSTVSATSWS